MSKKKNNVSIQISENTENNKAKPALADIEEPQSITNSSKPETMDIHAHHLHKAPGQRFWHYFFEFLMLFLAVFCGFLAEYRLEHMIERDREKEFIVAAIMEMKTDLVEIKDFESDSNLYKYQDSLSVLLLRGDRSQRTINKMYHLFFNYVYAGKYVGFKKSTLTQLKYAGNMRLIQNKNVVEKLIGWDGSIENAFDVLERYNSLLEENRNLGAKIFDAGYFVQYGDFIRVDDRFLTNTAIHLKVNNEQLIHELGFNLKNQAMMLRNYNKFIYWHKLFTSDMIDSFTKEYHLKNLESSNK